MHTKTFKILRILNHEVFVSFVFAAEEITFPHVEKCTHFSSTSIWAAEHVMFGPCKSFDLRPRKLFSSGFESKAFERFRKYSRNLRFQSTKNFVFRKLRIFLNLLKFHFRGFENLSGFLQPPDLLK